MLKDLFDFAKQYRKKHDAKLKKMELKDKGLLMTKKERLEKEKNEKARLLFEQLNNESKIEVPKVAGKTKLKKKRALKEKNQQEN